MTVENNPVIIADEGKMLFNGSVYSNRVFIGRLDSIDNWQEVPYSQYEEWKEENDRRMQEEHEARMNARAKREETETETENSEEEENADSDVGE